MQWWRVKLLESFSAAWQFRWYGVAAAWILCLVGWGGVAAMPDQYLAEAKVYIDTQTLLAPLLRGLAVSTDPDQQVEVMLKTLITRPNLEQVLRLTNPRAEKFTPAEMETEVNNLVEKIQIRSLGTKNMFGIGYVNDNNAYALLVTQTLLSILIDSNIGDKRRDAEGAKSFIDQRIAEYETMLRQAEKRRADFKAANLEIISRGTVATQVDAANAELKTATDSLALSQIKRDSLQKELGGVSAVIPAGDVGGQRAGGAPTLAQAKRTLSDLRLRYTEDHPDVVAAKRMIADLEAQKKKGGSDDEAAGGVPNPVYSDLKHELSEEDVGIALLQHRIEQAKAEIITAKQDTTHAIEIETKYADLDRDYGTIFEDYQALLKSRESARMSQALDSQEQTIAIRVVEPPEKPQHPTFPNRPLFNSLVLLVGLAGGIAMAVLLGMNSGRFVTSDQMAEHFNVPLIGVVTLGLNPAEARRERLAAGAIAISMAVLGVVYLGVLLALNASIYSSIGA